MFSMEVQISQRFLKQIRGKIFMEAFAVFWKMLIHLLNE